MSARGHETIDHAADMGIRGWGGTPAEAFEEIASAMFELMVDVRGLSPSKKLVISRSGVDLTELLIEFLNGFLAEADVAGIVLVRAAVGALERRDGGWAVEAVGEGVSLGEARDKLLVEVKAATYYGAWVREEKRGKWIARCVVDL